MRGASAALRRWAEARWYRAKPYTEAELAKRKCWESDRFQQRPSPEDRRAGKFGQRQSGSTEPHTVLLRWMRLSTSCQSDKGPLLGGNSMQRAVSPKTLKGIASIHLHGATAVDETLDELPIR
jgi:hypothetical protein